jgi:hypothetical protein
VRFQVLDIIPHLKNPVTGAIVSTADHGNHRSSHVYTH